MILKALISLTLALFINVAHAEPDENHEITQIELDKVIKDLSLMRKELIYNCSRNDDYRICIGDVKKEVNNYAPKAVVRVIRYRSAVTMDFSFNRVNIELDPNSKITRVSIG